MAVEVGEKISRNYCRCAAIFSLVKAGKRFTLWIHPGELPTHHIKELVDIDEPEMYNLYDKNRWIRYK